MAKDNDREAWERQPGESGPAFEAFAAYRDMGEKRTISAVARQLNKSGTLCHRWKLKYDWRARADAYDASIAEEARKQAVSERKKMQDRHIKMSLQLQRKAMEALEKIKPEEMTPKDVKEFLRLATGKRAYSSRPYSYGVKSSSTKRSVIQEPTKRLRIWRR